MTIADPIVLYVDDEASNRTVFSLTFGERFNIKTASSGDEALRIIASEDVGVLLTDQRMPGMTGNELLERVRRDHPNVLRMILTAYSDLDPILKAVNDGLVARYIIKPWS